MFEIYALADIETNTPFCEVYVKCGDSSFMEVDDFFSDGGKSYSENELLNLGEGEIGLL